MYIKGISKWKVSLLAMLLVLALAFSGCGAGRDEASDLSEAATSNDSAQRVEAKADGVFSKDGNNSGQYGKSTSENNEVQNPLIGRKIIKSSNISIETTDFDYTVNEIKKRTDYIGGYIESSNSTGKRINYKGNNENRQASFRLRIPESVFEKFISDVGDLGNIINDRNSGQDITDQYFDTEARLKTLRIQEERILDILRKAERIQDILELERELSDIRYRIENYTGTIRKWDNLVAFSTLEIVVYEVQEIKEIKPTPITFGEKIKNGFKSSVEALEEIGKGLVIFIVSLIPFLVIIIPVVFLILYIIRRNKGNKDTKNDEDSQ